MEEKDYSQMTDSELAQIWNWQSNQEQNARAMAKARLYQDSNAGHPSEDHAFIRFVIRVFGELLNLKGLVVMGTAILIISYFGWWNGFVNDLTGTDANKAGITLCTALFICSKSVRLPLGIFTVLFIVGMTWMARAGINVHPFGVSRDALGFEKVEHPKNDIDSKLASCADSACFETGVQQWRQKLDHDKALVLSHVSKETKQLFLADQAQWERSYAAVFGGAQSGVEAEKNRIDALADRDARMQEFLARNHVSG